MKDLCCPTCQADVLLEGDERAGDEVFCVYCGAPLKLALPAGDSDEAAFEIEEDY